MTELAISVLSRDEARSLTDEVKQDAERLWRKLVELHDGSAHHALGYSDWGDYFSAEFGQSKWQGYELLRAGRVVGELPSGGPQPTSHRQARELAPLLDQPDTLREAWAEASTNGTPTAAQVREVVAKHRPAPAETEERKAEQLRWAATWNVLDGLQHFDRDAVPSQAVREAALIDNALAVRRGEQVTPERLRRASAWTWLLAETLEGRTDG